MAGNDGSLKFLTPMTANEAVTTFPEKNSPVNDQDSVYNDEDMPETREGDVRRKQVSHFCPKQVLELTSHRNSLDG
jgi:hypothetical protein